VKLTDEIVLATNRQHVCIFVTGKKLASYMPTE